MTRHNRTRYPIRTPPTHLVEPDIRRPCHLAVDAAVELFGAERVVCGSNYPATTGVDYQNMIALANNAARHLRNRAGGRSVEERHQAVVEGA